MDKGSMKTRSTPRRREPSSWFRGLYRYYKDPSASPLGKLIVFFAAIYVVLPVDLIPDVPFIGWLDDIGVMGLAAAWVTRMASKYRNPHELRANGDDPEDDATRARFDRASFSGR